MVITDIVTDLADLGPRVLLVVVAFVAFNALAYTICLILNALNDDHGLFCLLVFVVCNIGSICAAAKILND